MSKYKCMGEAVDSLAELDPQLKVKDAAVKGSSASIEMAANPNGAVHEGDRLSARIRVDGKGTVAIDAARENQGGSFFTAYPSVGESSAHVKVNAGGDVVAQSGHKVRNTGDINSSGVNVTPKQLEPIAKKLSQCLMKP